MAIEKVGVYRKWLETIPIVDGKPISRSEWPKKRRHHWVVRWYGTNKRYGKVFETRKEAERYSQEIQTRANLGKPDKPRKIAIKDFLAEHLEVMKDQVAYGTLQEHKRALELFKNFIGESFLLCKIQPHHAEAFIADRLASKEVSIATVNKYIRTLQGIFNLAIVPRGYLVEGQNPFTKIKERKTTENSIRYVNPDEFRALRDVAKDIWWKAVLSIAFSSGLRRNEILNLTWGDVDFEHQQICVRSKKDSGNTIAWEPKNRKNRLVPMSNDTSRLLVNIQTAAPEGHPYIFVSPERLSRIKVRQKRGEWNSRSELIHNLNRKFNAIRVVANIAHCTLHDLRRSAITNWARALPIQVVQELAGHSDIKTTQMYYLAVRPEDMVAANKLMGRILSGMEDD